MSHASIPELNTSGHADVTSCPSVSVIVPVYNAEKFISETIESVIRQSYQDWELLLVDDCSSDHSVGEINRYVEKDPRVRLVESESNSGGPARPRNMGISQAMGRFIALLDADDKWFPDKLERCLAELDASGADAVCHGERWVGENGYSRDVQYGPDECAGYRAMLFLGNCVSTSAVVVRRDRVLAAGGFSEDKEIVSAEDYDLWLKLTRDGVRFVFVPEILGEYRRHESGISQGQINSIIRNVHATEAVVRQHYATLTGTGLIERMKYKRAIAKAYFSGGLQLHGQGAHFDAVKLYMRHIHMLPFVVLSYGIKRSGERLWH